MTATAAPVRVRRKVGFWWFALSAAAIAVFAALPYLTSSLPSLAEADNGLAANYAHRPATVQFALYAHIVGAALALLLSPLQFAARLRERAPRLHRVVGRTVFGAIMVGGAAGLVLAPFSSAGIAGTLGFGALAVLWVGSAVTALRAIRGGDVEAHRQWMVRTFALTYAAVTLRLWLPVLIVAQVAAAGVDGQTAFDRAYLVVPFLAWVPNLLVAHWWLRRR
ncbi:hypothetical protein Cs7R123_54340 [Catellatospora sp. TT07R-123]|uniref:DUF2306 domain-containing protein n=1 Tax=Catellatospora sp. TT07R-123 TaxID=2733863 RepID=UPI001B1F09B4|nr:DUF2306 domain-containing protein [Catellatospora sp. TT07R-123]GHJ48092.1 hypothetical protein Cs7R123_54340 [Catellatospora sp. TT07R-123]